MNAGYDYIELCQYFIGQPEAAICQDFDLRAQEKAKIYTFILPKLV